MSRVDRGTADSVDETGRGAERDTGRDTVDIAVVVARTGVPTTTLHVWERRGLIAPVGREGLRRQYAASVVGRIGVIVAFQRGGFTLTEIGELLAASGPDAKRLLATKLAELERRRAELEVAITGLRHGLDCPEPQPLDCARFHAQAASLLPVDRGR